MALWKPFRGSRAALDAVEKHDGYVYFCTDDGSLFFDYADADGNLQRKQINAKDCESILGMSLDEIKEYVAVQSDWNQTDATKADFILNKPVEATDDEVMALLISRNVIIPVSDSTGYVYLDKDQKILVM